MSEAETSIPTNAAKLVNRLAEVVETDREAATLKATTATQAARAAAANHHLPALPDGSA